MRICLGKAGYRVIEVDRYDEALRTVDSAEIPNLYRMRDLLSGAVLSSDSHYEEIGTLDFSHQTARMISAPTPLISSRRNRNPLIMKS
jgi:hypothetical protein